MRTLTPRQRGTAKALNFVHSLQDREEAMSAHERLVAGFRRHPTTPEARFELVAAARNLALVIAGSVDDSREVRRAVAKIHAILDEVLPMAAMPMSMKRA